MFNMVAGIATSRQMIVLGSRPLSLAIFQKICSGRRQIRIFYTFDRDEK